MLPSSATAYSALQDFNSKRQSAQDIYSSANTQYDVGGGQQRVSALNGQVGNLQSSLDAVDPSVTGRTSGTFTTEAQRSALVGREQAPIATNLSRTQSNLGTQQQNLSTSQGLASQLASAMIGQDQTKYQGLLDQYNAAKAAEAAAEAQREWEAQQAEASRQFNVGEANKLAMSKAASGAGGAGSYNLGGGLGASASSAPSVTQRSDKGFNFTDASGHAISAAKYASLTGTDLNSLLVKMGQAGDRYAAEAYNSLTKVNNAKAKANVMKNYNALFW